MFKSVESKIDFPAMERDILAWWNDNKIVEKYLVRNQNSKKRSSFIDGPITANNPMGVHHAWGRTYKDLFLRYKTMQGFQQRYQNGFDGQGLWIEVEVEKELGFKSKRDIESFGVDKFVELCKKEGIYVPIIPGIKILSTESHLAILPKHFHINLPSELISAVEGKSKTEIRNAGINWAVKQVDELIEAKVPCVHFYIMTSARSATQVVSEFI